MQLAGKRALITGASQGFGRSVAAAFIAEGADVMLCARDAERLDATRRELEGQAAGRVKVAAMSADIACEADVDRLVARTLDTLDGLDVLVANAGVYGPKGPFEQVDWAAWVQAIQINLLGTAYCCRAVLPHMKSRQAGRILVLAGGGATKPMPRISAYAASKAGIVRFAETLAEEVAEFGIGVNCIAPGALNTRLLDEVLAAGPERVGRAFYESAQKQRDSGGAPPEVGAALCVFLASSRSAGIRGKLISAIWDPWRDLPQYLADLRGSDIYTLRRIIPAERGKEWGEV